MDITTIVTTVLGSGILGAILTAFYQHHRRPRFTIGPAAESLAGMSGEGRFLGSQGGTVYLTGVNGIVTIENVGGRRPDNPTCTATIAGEQPIDFCVSNGLNPRTPISIRLYSRSVGATPVPYVSVGGADLTGRFTGSVPVVLRVTDAHGNVAEREFAISLADPTPTGPAAERAMLDEAADDFVGANAHHEEFY